MSGPGTHRRLSAGELLFAGTVFLSAFLLFQVQPLISKAILPWFGGTPGVWTTCLLFFQVVLFAGYAYAHLLTSRVPAKWQAPCHLLLLGVSVAALRILPGPASKPLQQNSPELQILWLLATTVGLPYFVISSTGPLLQSWFSQRYPGSSPYRLYALSNLGSLLALLSYPFVIEPLFSMPRQAGLWSFGFLAFSVLCASCAMLARRSSASQQQFVSRNNSAGRVTWTLRSKWLGLPMLASVMLLAVTNQVCQDVAVIPFLWVAPLSLYLLSFILTFESDRWHHRLFFALLSVASVLCVSCVLIDSSDASVLIQVGLYFTLLFAVCMLCHGELARLKPAPEHLTSFYLTMSAGGAIGGLLTGMLAPLLFPRFWELQLGLLACAGLALTVIVQERGWSLFSSHSCRRTPLAIRAGAGVTFLLLMFVLARSAGNSPYTLAATRNFYGTLSVERNPANDTLVLRHGRIIHGLQFLAPDKQSIPTTYYGAQSGLGLAIRSLRNSTPSLRIGGVGLGVGTLAAYGQAGDLMCFYEINDDVITLAEQHFTYLRDTAADCQMIRGDARLCLEAEAPRQFDLLVLDAFSGDAVPTHLLTEEAMRVYSKHLRDGGVLAVHISNLHFHLRPVVEALADSAGMRSLMIVNPVAGTDGSGQCGSKWMLLSSNANTLSEPALQAAASPPETHHVLWTDQFSNLLGVLR